MHYTSHENHIYEKKVPFQRKNLIVYVIDYHRFWIVMVRYLSVGNSIYCQNRFSYKVVLHLWNSWVYQQSVRRTHISCAIIFFCENIISFCENISTDCFAFIVLFFFISLLYISRGNTCCKLNLASDVASVIMYYF